MATVTSFEAMPHPSRSELRQFAELFEPLFHASSDEARRQAVAALSQINQVPPAVALFIGCQPIGIAAPFLTRSPALNDDTLITIARTQGAAHTRAIVRRDGLSPAVIDALVGLRHLDTGRSTDADAIRRPVEAPLGSTHAPKSNQAKIMSSSTATEREENLRRQLKELVRHLYGQESDRLGLRTLSDIQDALLVRFARERAAVDFATTLADALASSRSLAERILLDLSGHQLAITLTSLGMKAVDTAFVLCRFYPHLAVANGDVTNATALVASLDLAECDARIEAWRRADDYTFDRSRRDVDGSEPRKRASESGFGAASDTPLRSFGRARR